MEILFISFIAAIGYLIILCKLFGAESVTRHQVLWDILFTIGLPILFIGTFSGLATAFISGVFFSIITGVLGVFMSPEPERTKI